jgi:hypothetical protein
MKAILRVTNTESVKDVFKEDNGKPKEINNEK